MMDSTNGRLDGDCVNVMDGTNGRLDGDDGG